MPSAFGSNGVPILLVAHRQDELYQSIWCAKCMHLSISPPDGCSSAERPDLVWLQGLGFHERLILASHLRSVCTGIAAHVDLLKLVCQRPLLDVMIISIRIHRKKQMQMKSFRFVFQVSNFVCICSKKVAVVPFYGSTVSAKRRWPRRWGCDDGERCERAQQGRVFYQNQTRKSEARPRLGLSRPAKIGMF